jgi:hypothetical protein
MKLLTKAVLASLPKLYSTDDIPLEEKIAVCKFFDPCGRYTNYVFEGEPQEDGDVLFFSYVVSPLGPDCDEMGNTTLFEMQSVKNRFGLGIERDLHFRPTKMGEILAKAA